MNGYLLDTNVVSELRKRERCAPAVDAWAKNTLREESFLSVLIIGELIRGATLKSRSDPATGHALTEWIKRLESVYEERILPVSMEVAVAWGKLSAIRPIPPEDGLLAATALVHDLTFVTRNIRDVRGLGVSLLDPWKP